MIRNTFKKEYLTLLKKFEIEYEELSSRAFLLAAGRFATADTCNACEINAKKKEYD